MGLEPKIPTFEQAKTVHTLDRAATVIGNIYLTLLNYFVLTMLSVTILYSVDDAKITEYGTVNGMKIGRENRSTWSKPAPMPLRSLH